MLEAKIKSISAFKTFLNAIEELASEVSFEPRPNALTFQAMNSLGFAFVKAQLNSDAFMEYRCDYYCNTLMELDLSSVTRMLKCVEDDYTVTLKTSEYDEYLSWTLEAPSLGRVAEYDMRFEDIHILSPQDLEYDATIAMPASLFTQVLDEIAQPEGYVTIDVSKEGIRFTAEGPLDISVLVKQFFGKKVQPRDRSDLELSLGEEQESGRSEKKETEGDGNGVEAMGIRQIQQSESAKSGTTAPRSGGQEDSEAEGDENQYDDGYVEDDYEDEDEYDEEDAVFIVMLQPVNAIFKLSYLAKFAKAGSLSSRVLLRVGNHTPLMVGYTFRDGFVEYHLAPSIPEG